MHQLVEGMEIEKQVSIPTNAGLEETTSYHIFCAVSCFLKLLEFFVFTSKSIVVGSTRNFSN
jgi:hypothetical protein